MSKAETTLRTVLSYKRAAIGRAGLIGLGILSSVFTSTAVAQDSNSVGNVPGITSRLDRGRTDIASSGLDQIGLPALNSIGPKTDIRIFLGSEVPEQMRVAALRRAWIVDPAIRDFQGLEGRYAWDFNDPEAMPGFGALDADSYVYTLVARLHSQPLHLPTVSTRQRFRAVFGLVSGASD